MFRKWMKFKDLRILLLPVFLSCFFGISNVKSETCPPLISTINIVDKCPVNETEWLKAKGKKQCSLQITNNCTDVQYHCLADRFHERFVEVCAEPKFIVGQHCPFYDLDFTRIEPNFNQPCRDPLNPCPAVYNSSSVYKYQGCLKKSLVNERAHVNSNSNPDIIEINYKVLQSGLSVLYMLLIIQALLLLILICCQDGCKRCLKKIYQRLRKRGYPVKDEENVQFIKDNQEPKVYIVKHVHHT